MELQKDYEIKDYEIIYKSDKDVFLHIFKDINETGDRNFTCKVLVDAIFDLLDVFVIDNENVLYYNTCINIIQKDFEGDVKNVITNIPTILGNENVSIVFNNRRQQDIKENIKTINVYVKYFSVKGLRKREMKPYFNKDELKMILTVINENDFCTFKKTVYDIEFKQARVV